MERLRQRDLRLLTNVLSDLTAGTVVVPEPLHLLQAVGRLVPGDVLAFNEVGPRPELTKVVSDPPVSLILPGSDVIFAKLAATHPLVVHYRLTGDGHAVKFSDLLTRTQLHQLEIYQAIFRPCHFEDQMALTLAVKPDQVVGIVINRTRPTFTERDRALLDLLRPYLAHVQRQAALLAQLEQAFAAGDQGVLVLTATNGVAYASSRALAWLAAYFGPPQPTSVLPDELARWLRWCAEPDGDGLPRRVKPLIVMRGSRRLIVHALIGPLGSTLLLREETPLTIAPLVVASLGLTDRETEVLNEVARGRTDAQAADTLYVSRRTVQKHLEHVYRKLGVTNRAEAIQVIQLASRQAMI